MGTSKDLEVARVMHAGLMWMEGPVHEVRARARAAEKRGEIRVAWAHCKPGLVPYIELMSREERRWQARRRHALWAGSGMVAGTSLAYALWSARWVVLALSLAAILAWLVKRGGFRITVVQSVNIRTK